MGPKVLNVAVDFISARTGAFSCDSVLSYSGCPVLAVCPDYSVLSRLSCPSCLVPAQLLRPDCPVQSVLS
jgi:hypothetical protein